MNKKASISIYLTFMIVGIIIILFAAVFAPMGVLFNTEMYVAGEKILKDSNQSIQEINDTAVRTQLTDGLNNAFAASQNNVDVNQNLFQYGWVLILVLTAVVSFLYTRRLVEVGGGRFV